MEIDWDDLKKAAAKTRAALAKKGIFDPGKGKIRRKPRDPEKLAALKTMAEARLKKYKPYRDKEGNVILPWFSR